MTSASKVSACTSNDHNELTLRMPLDILTTRAKYFFNEATENQRQNPTP